MKDFYYILGTDTNCTSGEINEAYTKLAEKFRPDLNHNDNYFENRFREIREAYEVLSDPVKRNRYDQELRKLKPYTISERKRIKKYYSRAKGLNVFFTLILIALTFVFGHYVIHSIHNSQVAKVAQVQAHSIDAVPVHKVKHHKKRHFVKVKAPNKVPATTVALVKQPLAAKAVYTPANKFKADSLKVHTVQQVMVNTKHVAVENAVNNGKRVNNNLTDNTTHTSSNNYWVSDNHAGSTNRFAGDSHNNTSNTTASSFQAYIRANETGMVNMRRFDYFNSDIIREIPDGSKVVVLEKGKFYYKILFENATGYVPKWTITH